LLILPLSLRITKPLRELHSLAHEWAEGRLDRRARIRGKDEIAQLGSVFNTMAENLQKTLEQRKEFLALISHELKSPLARMRIALELLSEKHETQTDMMEIINGINTEIAESEQLIDQLLVLSKVEMTLPSSIREPFDLSSAVKRAIEHVMPLAQARKIEVGSHLGSVLKVQGDSLQIQRALVNIIENAIKFSPEGSKIIVKLEAREQTVEIVIADQGPGIPEEERKKIFQPFYRVNQENQGSGLGLYIARKIIELHGGTIEAFANDPHGTIIKVVLPAHNA
jgi:two-component system sensor histidine kinase CpxA